MSVVEIRCPNCSSPSVTKQGNEYTCDHCRRKFQIIAVPKKEDKTNGVVPQIKYGKVNFNIDQAKTLGNFVLEPKPILTYLILQVFKYHAHKNVVRGNKPIIASEFGYVLVSPFTGKIDTYLNKSNKLPDVNDCKQGIYQEFMKVVVANAVDDKPLMPMNIPNALPLATLQNGALSWIAQNLSVKKTYIQSTAVGKKGDLGIREIIVKFSKNNFDQFGSIGTFGVPVFNLSYKLPNSPKIFKRSIGGYSGEVLNDELRCAKPKLLGKACEDFPENVCAVCGNLICSEHSKQCEKCRTLLCKDCATSKGLISKHYFCSKCA
jgi:hypothetical protein